MRAHVRPRQRCDKISQPKHCPSGTVYVYRHVFGYIELRKGKREAIKVRRGRCMIPNISLPRFSYGL